MNITVEQVARAVGGEIIGDPQTQLSGIAGLQEATESQLTFLANPKYLPLLKTTRASAIIVSFDFPTDQRTYIRVKNASVAFSKAAELFVSEHCSRISGIHSTAVIGENVSFGDNVAIGPHAVIESDVSIGAGSVITAGTFVGQGCRIGEECYLYSNVSVNYGCHIGDRVIIHSGTVIGSDGFGYERVDGRHVKIPQIGNVVIEDDVEIGANVTVDRARFNQTRIGRGTKIDNLVQIGHNVIIGEHCIIIAQVAISGSTRLENNVILAGQVGVSGHITIGENAVVGAQSGVSKSLPGNASYFGYPAKPMAMAKRLQAAHARLPVYIDMIHSLQKRVDELEKKIS